MPILSVLTWLPLLGAAVVLALPSRDDRAGGSAAKWAGLWCSLVVLALAVLMVSGFDRSSAAYQFTELHGWMAELDLGYRMGVDGVSVLFVLLTALLIPVCILASWHSVTRRVREYVAALLVLETMVVGMFATTDLLMFYVFFEGVLMPMFLLIGIWGGARRIYASFKFFLYTLTGSVLMLLAVLAMWRMAGTSDIAKLSSFAFPPRAQFWLFLAFFASFAVKVPMWPVHTWLPDAHVEAPTAGSVILAGILLKMGGYGFLRFSIPMFPDASAHFAPMVFALSVVAVFYASWVAFAQTDVKKLIAYSSIAHMGVVTIGLFTFNTQGVDGAIFQMLSHGIVSSGLFLCVGVVYDKLHTRDIARFGGLAPIMPAYAVLFAILMLGSVGLPGTSGFVGEFLALIGMFKVSLWLALLGSVGMVLGAVYMLSLFRRMVYGVPRSPEIASFRDLDLAQWLTLAPLAAITVWMGVMPNVTTGYFASSVNAMLLRHEPALVSHTGQAENP